MIKRKERHHVDENMSGFTISIYILLGFTCCINNLRIKNRNSQVFKFGFTLLFYFLLVFSPIVTTKGMSLMDCDTIYTEDFYKIKPKSSDYHRQTIIESLRIDSLVFDTTSSYIICPNQHTQYSPRDIMRLFDLGRAYFENSEIDKAKTIFDQLLLQDKIHEYTSLYSRIHNFLGLINNIANDKLSAFFHFQMLLQAEEKNSPEINATAYLNLGAIYAFFKDYDQAESLYKKGLAVSKVSFLEHGWLLHRLGELKQKTGYYQESEHYLLKAQNHWLEANDLRSNCFTESVLGELYSKTKSNNEAILFLKETLKKESHNKQSLCRLFLLKSLGDKSLVKSDYVSALNYYQEMIQSTNQKEVIPHKISAYKQLVEVYLKQYEIDKALAAFKDYTELTEEYYIKDYEQTAVSFQRIKGQLEKEETLKLSQRKEIQMEEELDFQKIINGIGLSMLLMSSLFGGGIYYYFIKQKKSKILLSKLNIKMRKNKLP